MYSEATTTTILIRTVTPKQNKPRYTQRSLATSPRLTGCFLLKTSLNQFMSVIYTSSYHIKETSILNTILENENYHTASH